MPIPFIPIIVGGISLAAGAFGAIGHLVAKDTNKSANERVDEANALYRIAKKSLDEAKKQAEDAAKRLGETKLSILSNSMEVFVQNYRKIKDFEILLGSKGSNELSQFTFKDEDISKVQELNSTLEEILFTGKKAAIGGMGAVTGIGGAALAEGILGLEGALIFEGLFTPLALLASPAILFAGVYSSIKADENLDKANEIYAKAEKDFEQAKIAEALGLAIAERANMFNELLNKLNNMFDPCSKKMADMIQKKESMYGNEKLLTKYFYDDDKELLDITTAMAGAIKAILYTPIVGKDGQITKESKLIHSEVSEKLPIFKQKSEYILAVL